jgi:hypothetical protein
MKNIVKFVAIAAATSLPALQAQAPQTDQGPPQQTAAPPSPAPGSGLSDLDAMTFGCPKAALNAAAREAATVKSQGTYQFAYFRIVSDSHHAAYEVHFKSNYEGEPDLKYCVSIYCQQGWDPKTTKTSVTPISDRRARGKPAAGHGVGPHRAACDVRQAPASRRTKKSSLSPNAPAPFPEP